MIRLYPFRVSRFLGAPGVARSRSHAEFVEVAKQTLTAKDLQWDMRVVRRSRKRPSKLPTNPHLQASCTYIIIAFLCVFYYTSTTRSSFPIVLMDSLVVHSTICSLIKYGISQWELLQQLLRNKLQHIKNGNTTTLQLDLLIPHKYTEYPQATMEYSFIHQAKLSRDFLLSQRPISPPKLPENSPFPQLTPRPKIRTGRRVSYRFTDGRKVNYTRRPLRHFSASRPFRLPTNSQKDRPTPPPRGTPGPGQPGDEECITPPPPSSVHPLGLGARSRRLRRQLFRRWRRSVGGPILPEASGSALVKGGVPLKAVKSRRQTGVRNSYLFKTLILRPEQIGKQKKATPPAVAPPPLPYGQPFKIGTQNVQGMAEILKHQSVLTLLRSRKLDVLFLTETRNTTYHQFTSEGHRFISNGSNKDKFAGVTAIIPPQTLPHLKDVVQHSARILQITLAASAGDVHLIGVYSPHNKRDVETSKLPFWDKLDSVLHKIPQPEPVYIIGDFNVRLQGRKPDEHHMLGPNVYGKGRLSILTTEGNNRELYLRFLSTSEAKDVLTYKQSNLLKHITYRDKSPPPLDWLTFSGDPIGWLPIWDRFQSLPQSENENLKVAGKVRDYLTCYSALVHEQQRPTIDPHRFQALDRLVTRSKWLPTVQQCQAVHSTGFVSDHYLLESVIRVKLKAQPPSTIKPPARDYSTIDYSAKTLFNHTFKKCTKHKSIPNLNTTDANWAVYTDGSGSKGRCSATTPAGWGYTIITTNQDSIASKGPVSTDPHAAVHLGATVGSNNTGELSAWMEAALYILTLTTPPKQISFYYDSRWMSDAVRGRSKAKRHKTMIKYARILLAELQNRTTVDWFWVKGHSGDHFNEIADRLAEEGKQIPDPMGGRHDITPLLTPSEFIEPVQSTDHSALERLNSTLVRALHKAESQHIPLLKRKPKQPWMTQELLQQFHEVRHLKSIDHSAHIKKHKLLKKQARKIKREWTREQLLTDPNPSHTKIWKQVQSFKKG